MRPAHWKNDQEHFYKYMTRSTCMAVLTTRSLRWSVPSRFNDPFDVQFDLQAKIDAAAVKRSTLDALWQAHYGTDPVPVGNEFGHLVLTLRGTFPRLSRDDFDREFGETIDTTLQQAIRKVPELARELQSRLADVKLLCLSETAESILMWSHYSEQHQGIVLRFKCRPETDGAWGAAVPVNYCRAIPNLIDDQFAIAMLSGQRSMTADYMVPLMIYNKAVEWSYEKEWRVCSGSGRSSAETEDCGFAAQDLDAVYFGCRTPDEDCRAIARVVKAGYPNAELIRAQKSASKFELVFIPEN